MITNYDEQIVALIKDHGKMSNREIRAILAPEAKTYVRPIDTALQRLRKTGRIEAQGQYWVLTGRKTCAHCQGRGWTT